MTAALGWIGSALVVLSLTQRDLRRLRQVNLAASLVLLTFNLVVGIASMVALNVALAAINGRHLLADRSGRRRRADERSVTPRSSRIREPSGRHQATSSS